MAKASRAVLQSLQPLPYTPRVMVGAGLEGWRGAAVRPDHACHGLLAIHGDPPSPPGTMPAITGKTFTWSDTDKGWIR